MSVAILYDKPECPFCWRLRMALTHLDVPFERRAYDDPEHQAVWPSLTPFDTVPVLKLDDTVLVDSSLAIEYLDERFGGVWPSGMDDRVRARTIARYADERVGAAVREVVFEKRGRPESDWDRDRINRAVEAWRKALPYVERELDEMGRFGERLSMADFALATRVGLAAGYGLELDDEFSRLQRWFARLIGQRWFTEHAPPVVSDWLARSEVKND
jgi:glutathione S-transferase